MKRILFACLMVVCAVVSATAQIGYQVTIFDEAKKAPKSNQTVSATVTITDNSGKVICSDNVSGTTDEFGILSMSVGNATTFSNVDWSKLPLWISATVDGVTISKTQILNVPVAEHAKHTGVLTPELLSGKSVNVWDGVISFSSSGASWIYTEEDGHTVSKHYEYEIDGNNVYVLLDHNNCWTIHYSKSRGKLYVTDD